MVFVLKIHPSLAPMFSNPWPPLNISSSSFNLPFGRINIFLPWAFFSDSMAFCFWPWSLLLLLLCVCLEDKSNYCLSANYSSVLGMCPLCIMKIYSNFMIYWLRKSDFSSSSTLPNFYAQAIPTATLYRQNHLSVCQTDKFLCYLWPSLLEVTTHQCLNFANSFCSLSVKYRIYYHSNQIKWFLSFCHFIIAMSFSECCYEFHFPNHDTRYRFSAFSGDNVCTCRVFS